MTERFENFKFHRTINANYVNEVKTLNNDFKSADFSANVAPPYYIISLKDIGNLITNKMCLSFSISKHRFYTVL